LYGEYPASKIISELDQDDLLPAILFRGARKQCDADVIAISRDRRKEISIEKRNAIKHEVSEVIRKYGVEDNVITDHPHYQALIRTACGAHHAGQLLIWRLLLEELMTRGMLRLMVATGTVAAGVDFPARTVVVTAHSKRGSEGFNVLTASEFQQMSGRAGRRGKDAVGICVVAPGPFCDARVIHEVAKSPPEPLRSSYFASPSTMLNLLKFRNVDDLRFTVSKSLASFLDRKSAKVVREEGIKQQAEAEENQNLGPEAKKRALKKARRKITEAEILESKQEKLLVASLEGLSRLKHVEEGSLTEKGYWAAELFTSLVLELAEAVDSGLFYDLQVEELVALVASIAGDPYRNYFSLRENPIKKEYYKEMQRITTYVSESYKLSKEGGVEVVPDAALTVLLWMDSKGWPEYSGLLRLAGVADGDAARLISQTADHLNQLSRLKETHPTIAAAASEGRDRLMRPPLVDSPIAD